ncbi:hypothetical protein, partial [uncultured Duodenibacillus sp.]|uniref:hypothetical protein n=2 Tax=Duodenibacillus TaxID=1980697 RepID=UPI0025975F7D
VNQPYVGPCDAVTINPPSSDGGLFTLSGFTGLAFIRQLPEVAEFDFCFWLLAVLSSANRQIFLRTEFKAKSRFETFAQLAQKKT